MLKFHGQPEVEFFGVDDYAVTGKLFTEIKLEGNQMCRYPDDPVPLAYGAFHIVGLPTVVTGPRVRNAWDVLVNIADHRAILAHGLSAQASEGPLGRANGRFSV